MAISKLDKMVRFLAAVGLTVLFRIFWGFKIYGAKNIPKEGGLILAGNHASYFDSPFLGLVIWKRENFKIVARDTLFKGWFSSWILNAVGSLSVKCGSFDRQAWKTLEKLVMAGTAVVIYPEGTRTSTGELGEAFPGAGMLVYRAGAKVVPVYLDTFEVWPKGQKLPSVSKRASIIFGQPILFDGEFSMPSGREAYEAITRRIMSEIGRLKDDLKNIKRSIELR